MNSLPDRLARRLNLRGQVLLVMGVVYVCMGTANLSGDDPPLIQWLIAPAVSSGVWIGVGLLAICEAWKRHEHQWVWWVMTIPPIARCVGLGWELLVPWVGFLQHIGPEPDVVHAGPHPYLHVGSLFIRNLCQVIWPLMMAGIVNRPDENTIIDTPTKTPERKGEIAGGDVDAVAERAVWKSVLGIIVKGRPKPR